MKNLINLFYVCLVVIMFMFSCGCPKSPKDESQESEPNVNPVKLNLGMAALAYKSGDCLKCEEYLKKTQNSVKQAFSPFMTPEVTLDIAKMNQSLASQDFQVLELIQDMETMAQLRIDVATCLWSTGHRHEALAALKALVDFGRTYPLSETTRMMVTTNLETLESWTEKGSEKNPLKR